MATEVYHKVGRGGAGNFYTKAEKAAAIAVSSCIAYTARILTV